MRTDITKGMLFRSGRHTLKAGPSSTNQQVEDMGY